MTEITETVTMTLERFKKMLEKEEELKNEITTFESLFELKEINEKVTARVKKDELERWAKVSLGISAGVFSYKLADELVIETEESK